MDERELKKKTKEYWSKIDRDSITDRLEWYAKNLLPDEMIWAEDNQADDSKPRITKLSEPCDLLVMLVGLSVEPLLQTIYAYNPKKVLLLYAKNYGDPDDDNSISGERLTRTVKDLIPEATSSIKAEHIGCHLLETTDTVSIFRILLNEIGETSGNVIIDITGGKKNMIAGAFLYAAYANIKVSYVDFDDDAYDTRRGRPYGHRCRIGLIENPYQTFALRDWEQVRTLYNRYNFRAARALLVGLDEEEDKETILAAAKIYLPEQVKPIKKMTKLLQCYEAWDNAEFGKAKGFADEIAWNNEFPRAINELGGTWYRRFNDIPKFRVYIFDELKRIRRLFKNENYRATFLRAGNLSEIIMLARLVRLFGDADKQKLLDTFDNPDSKTPTAKSIYLALSRERGSKIKISSDKKPSDDRSNTFYVTFNGAPEIETTLMQKMDSWWNQTTHFTGDEKHNTGWEKFLNKRNRIAHAFETVERGYAEDALLFVQANFEDFLGNVSIDDYGPAEILCWSKLCERCELKPHLPINLRQDQ
jgi:hypothetical protein